MTTLVLGTALFLGVGAAPALADPARPSNYRSTVTGVDGPPGVSAQILGGDAFISLTNSGSSEVVVEGYKGEPYLKFAPDGTVSANVRSPAYWLNADRFGRSRVPSEASETLSPDWKVVATDGTYAWHDHDIHWMSVDPPPGIDRSIEGRIKPWVVTIDYEGKKGEITGVLDWIPSRSPVPWVALSLVALAALVLLQSRPSLVVPVLAVASVMGVVVGLGQVLASPFGFGELRAWVPPALAIGAVGAAIVTKTGGTGWPATLGALVLLVWAVLRIPVFWMPSLPTAFPAVVERMLSSLVLGLAASVVAIGVRNRLAPVGSPAS